MTALQLHDQAVRLGALDHAVTNNNSSHVIRLIGVNEYHRHMALLYAVRYERVNLVHTLIVQGLTSMSYDGHAILVTTINSDSPAIIKAVVDAALNQVGTVQQRAGLMAMLYLAYQTSRTDGLHNARMVLLGVLTREREEGRRRAAVVVAPAVIPAPIERPPIRRSSRASVPAKTSELCAQCSHYHSVVHEQCR